MILHTAELIARGAQMNDGITAPIRAVVRLNGRDVAVILKEIEPNFVAAECFAALLLRGWGLNVPEPVLVNDGGKAAFGSLEMDYPSLKQRLQLDNMPEQLQAFILTRAANLISTWTQTPLAIAADEAIGNKDRNLGNVLWDGGEPYFIDHERSFGLVQMDDSNKLAMIVSMGDAIESVKQSAVRLAMSLLPNFGDNAQAASIGLDTALYNDYIKTNTQLLAQKILNRFPQVQDLLSKAQ